MTQELVRTTPEAVGIPSAAVHAFVDAIEGHEGGAHSFMLVRHGQVAAEGWWAPYAPERPHMLFSLSKSFTATAVGLCVEVGLLSVDDSVLSFFPAQAPAEPGEYLRAMRVRHLLSMNTGHSEDTLEAMQARPDGDWARAFIACPVTHAPGSLFCYNSGASYMLSAIVQRLTGTPLVEYLQSRLFAPLGIPAPRWDTCPQGVNAGGWGLNLRTEDIARFGQLYLQRGRWGHRQIVPEAWVAEATTMHSDNSMRDKPDWRQGYGYQFWMCRHGAYRGDGAHGQFCVVMPAQNAVLAITSGVSDLQAVLDAVWTHLLPAMGPEPLAPVAAADRVLADRLAGLTLATPTGRPTSPLAAAVSGRSYRFDGAGGIARIAMTFSEDSTVYTLQDDVGTHTLAVGQDGVWREGVTRMGFRPSRTIRDVDAERPVAASGAWVDENIYALKLCFFETPFHPTVTLRFEGDTVTMALHPNVGWDGIGGVALTGRAE